MRTLAAGTATAGRAEAAWDLRTDAGQTAPDGICHARLGFAGGSVPRRVLVLR